MVTLSETTTHINERLDQLIPLCQVPHASLFKAARYSLLLPGKRLRPRLTLALSKDLNVPTIHALDPACALEMIHTYSLIHDDLPCMDDDDLRRGQPTLHKVYNEGHAVLTGDFLLTRAFEVLACAPGITDHQKSQLVHTLSKRAGANGMVGGQVVDVESEGKIIDQSILLFMFENKTAALLAASLEFGGILGEVSPHDLQLLYEIGRSFGIAFQVRDDILEATSSEDVLGKPINSDIKNQKATAVSLFGLQKAEKLCQEYSSKALKTLDQLSFQPAATQALLSNH